MNHLRPKHWLALGIGVAVLLAGALTAVLLMGKDIPHTPSPDTAVMETENQATAPSNPYAPTVTITDDTLSPGQMWDISITFGDEERQQHFEMHGVVFLQYRGKADVAYIVNIKNSMISSQLPSLYVPDGAPSGTYDLYVGMENMTTEGCRELGCDSFETIRLENFLTVIPPAYEDYTVTASLSPNVLEPGAALDGILSINVRLNGTTTSAALYPAPELRNLSWKAEMRQVDGDYRFEVWDQDVAHVFFSDNSLLRKNAVPADAPEGFYDLVVSMEEYGYEWVFPKLLLVWPEGKSLFDDLPAYEDFTCTAEITDNSVTCIRGDAPEITVDLTCKGEVYRDFEAYLEFDQPAVSNPYTIPLTFDEETGQAVFRVGFDTPIDNYALVVKDTRGGYTWRFPSFVTVEHWAYYTVSDSAELELYMGMRVQTLTWGDEIETYFLLDSPEGPLTAVSAFLEYVGPKPVFYTMPLWEPWNPSAVMITQIPEDAPAGPYDLVVEVRPALAPSEPNYGRHSWRFPNFVTVITGEDETT